MSEPTSARLAIALRYRALCRGIVGRAGGAVQALAIGADRARRAVRAHAIAQYITGGIRAVHVGGGASTGAGRRHCCATGAVRRTSGLGRQAPGQAERLGGGIGPAGGRRVQSGSQKRRNDLRPYLHCAQKTEAKNHRKLDLSFQEILLLRFCIVTRLPGDVKRKYPGQAPAKAPSFRTVFQFRPVPREPSFFSITVIVSFDSPIPSG